MGLGVHPAYSSISCQDKMVCGTVSCDGWGVMEPTEYAEIMSIVVLESDGTLPNIL